MTFLPKRDGQLGNGKNGMMESLEIYRNRTILGSFDDKMDVSDSTMKEYEMMEKGARWC